MFSCAAERQAWAAAGRALGADAAPGFALRVAVPAHLQFGTVEVYVNIHTQQCPTLDIAS